ncbi:RNA polymerase sigma factor [Sphingomonas oligophenolica]|uniref:RNA polymerase sigma factor n=2 Tax=Sphingomonas oligophenolica TaxID=301154 RepID=A0A502CMD1_9SPHN|nr:RNA polymerase sigma factor [Sphingomonas oligophenolica]
MNRHRTMIYRLVVGNIGDADEALDLVQETFLSAHRALRRYDAARSIRAWLAAIAINKCRDWGRRRAVRRALWFARPIDDNIENIASDRPSPEHQEADRQELVRLQRAVRDLPASMREPLVLHTIEGMSQAETAEILSISEKAVETRIRRARAKLVEILAS